MQEKVLQVNFQSEVSEETTVLPFLNNKSSQLTIDIPRDALQDNFLSLHQTVPSFSTNQFTRHMISQNLLYPMVQTTTDECAQNISSTQQMCNVQKIEGNTSSSEEDSDRSYVDNDMNHQIPRGSGSELELSPASECLNTGDTNSINSSSTNSPISKSTDSKKQKKNRTTYTPSQVQMLERSFYENPYPDSVKIETMAIDLKVAEPNVKIWFQNKRARCRKRAQEKPQQHALPHMSPIIPQMGPYGMLPPHHSMLHGSPANMMPRPFFYPGLPMPMHHHIPASTITSSINQQQLPGIQLHDQFSSSPTSSTPSPRSSTSSSPNSSDSQSPETTRQVSHMQPNMLHLKQYMPLSYPYGMCPPFYYGGC
ncbi:homeobox protein vent1-like [Mytilus edulis]|uniref:homeobox protein vent1-like n=1 Tax=Mytilus edulis TaxID=6550 RepID=UPI0039EF8121